MPCNCKSRICAKCNKLKNIRCRICRNSPRRLQEARETDYCECLEDKTSRSEAERRPSHAEDEQISEQSDFLPSQLDNSEQLTDSNTDLESPSDPKKSRMETSDTKNYFEQQSIWKASSQKFNDILLRHTSNLQSASPSSFLNPLTASPWQSLWPQIVSGQQFSDPQLNVSPSTTCAPDTLPQGNPHDSASQQSINQGSMPRGFLPAMNPLPLQSSQSQSNPCLQSQSSLTNSPLRLQLSLPFQPLRSLPSSPMQSQPTPLLSSQLAESFQPLQSRLTTLAESFQPLQSQPTPLLSSQLAESLQTLQSQPTPLQSSQLAESFQQMQSQPTLQSSQLAESLQPLQPQRPSHMHFEISQPFSPIRFQLSLPFTPRHPQPSSPRPQLLPDQSPNASEENSQDSTSSPQECSDPTQQNGRRRFSNP